MFQSGRAISVLQNFSIFGSHQVGLMKIFSRFLCAIISIVVCVLLSSQSANATTVVMLSDTDLVRSSRVILTGRVNSVFAAWDDSGSNIWTYVEVQPEQILKGELAPSTVVLKQPGGIVGTEGVLLYGQPVFSAGQRVLLYLNPASDGSLHVAHIFMGMFSILDDPASGQSFVERWQDVASITKVSRPDGDSEITDRAPVGRYIRMIRRTLNDTPSAGEGEILPAFVAVPPEYSRKKAEAAVFTPAFVLSSGGVRWPDGSQPVVFLVNPDRSPIAGGGQSELTRAMAAWPNQSGANIRLQLGGQTSVCGYAVDGISSISYGDCQGVLDTPINCSGTVAQTQIAFTSQTTTVSGQAFRQLVEADLIFNKGMECFLSNSANLAETACHELGHAIGLGHSADSSAIMWASVRGHGRDATLAADDKAGALFIYPASGGGGGGGGAVSITSFSLPAATVGQQYAQTLSASGGTRPYSWRQLGGQIPPGLSLSFNGTIAGVPSQAGSYSLLVQVIDSTPGNPSTDSKTINITIQSQPSIFPLITRVKVKGSKKLHVFGENFRSDSLLLLNGVLITPKSVTFDGTTWDIFCKRRLNLGAPGSNVVQVLNPDGRSSPFFF
jgi:hypothetical protein